MLLNEGIKLAFFEQLRCGAQGHAEGRDGRAQTERLLHRTGGAHFVVAQTDTEPAGLAVATASALRLELGIVVNHGPQQGRSGASVPYQGVPQEPP